jgi:hypothetical protein
VKFQSVAPFNLNADFCLSDDTFLISSHSIDLNAVRGTVVALTDDEQTHRDSMQTTCDSLLCSS